MPFAGERTTPFSLSRAARTRAPREPWGRGSGPLRCGVALLPRRQSAGVLLEPLVKSIDRLSDSQVLALARFIAGCAQSGSRRWRTKFNECARRNNFGPYVASADQDHLRSILLKRDRVAVCGLATTQVVEAANQVAREWGEPIVTIELPDAAASG